MFKYKYAWKRDLPDQRDVLYARRLTTNLPARVDLRAQQDTVYDQGSLGSCTANAICGAINFEHARQTEHRARAAGESPSRLFVYYNERALENTLDEDSGAQLRTGIKACAALGACSELLWPYDIDKFRDRPSAECFESARRTILKRYIRLDNSNILVLKDCLAQGYPFVFGFSVYESFESERVATTGIVELPEAAERCLGGHAALCVGYNDSTQQFVVRNSWSREWGDAGHFYLPYSFMTSGNAADFWTLRFVQFS